MPDKFVPYRWDYIGWNKDGTVFRQHKCVDCPHEDGCTCGLAECGMAYGPMDECPEHRRG